MDLKKEASMNNLKLKIHKVMAKQFDEQRQKDHEKALEINENIDDAMKGLAAAFGKDLLEEIQAAGIAIEFVVKEWSHGDDPDVVFKYETGNAHYDEGETYPEVLSFSIYVERTGRWGPEDRSRSMGQWPEELLLEMIQEKFNLLDRTPFRTWDEIKDLHATDIRNQATAAANTAAAEEYEEILTDFAGDVANGMGLADIKDQEIPRHHHPFDPAFEHPLFPNNNKNPIAKAFDDTQKMVKDIVGATDDYISDLQQEVDPAPEEEEDGFKDVARDASALLQHKMKQAIEDAKNRSTRDLVDRMDNNLGYDVEMTGTNHPPGVSIPKDDGMHYSKHNCPDCGYQLISTGGYFFCGPCEKKFSAKVIVNEG